MAESNQNQSIHKISRLSGILNSAYKKSRLSRRVSFILFFTGFLLFGLMVFTLFESALYLSPIHKTVTAVIILLIAASSAYGIVRNAGKESRTRFISTYLRTREKDGEKIQSALDLERDTEQKRSVFYEAALEANLDSVNTDSLQQDINRYMSRQRPVRLALWSTIFSLIAITGLTLAIYSEPDAFTRSVTVWEAYEKPNPYTYEIKPGNATIEQGLQVIPSIEFTDGNHPDNVILSFKTEVEENFRERPMRLTEGSLFEAREMDATSSITYRVQMDEFYSDTYQLNVQVQPRFDDLVATIQPPAYTRLPDRELTYPFSTLRFYPGSTILIEGRMNKPVESLRLLSAQETIEFSDSDNDTLKDFRAELTPTEDDTLIFEMTDHEGLQNRNPFRTLFQVRQDERPVVVIREPTGVVMKNDPRDIEILYQATDDFGIERAELRWEIRRAYVDQPEQFSRELATPENGRNTRFTWDLSELELRPRDEVAFHIRALDNDAVSGGKWGESQEVVIQRPSLADFFEEIDSKERNVQDELDQVSDDFQQMEQEFERFLDRLRQNPEGGFEEQEMLENVTEQQQRIDETVEQLKEQFEELRREMDQSSSISDETRESYRELQQLMEELDDPDLQNALQQLREAMENMNPNQIEQALENVTFNEELYKERLERTKELFKQLKMNSDLDKLAQQYEDLSERLKEDPESTLEQLRQEMETVREDADKLSEQLDRVDQNPPKRSEEKLREMKQQAQERLDQMKEQMEQMDGEMDQQMQDGETSPSEDLQQQQQQISQQMQEEADNIRQMRQEMGGQQMQVNILALQRALYTLLELSETQEFLTKDSQETANRSAGFVNLARQQNYIRTQFSSVADTLYQVSAEIPGVPNRINRKKAEVERTLQRAVDNMAERNQRGATITTRESLGGINDLSSTIASLIDQLMDQDGDGGGGGGMSMEQMLEQMQKMSGDQQELNQQIQDMVNDMQGDRLSREQSERLDQMAQQQNEIRRQLRELQQSGALRQGDQGLSELQRMIDEMEDSINDMRGGVTDRMMIERQQNILSRMLSAEEAMEQRGEEDEREGTRAERFDSDLPPDMTLEELQQEIRSRLQDPNYTRFSEEYQRLIERYFEMLRRLDDEILPQ